MALSALTVPLYGRSGATRALRSGENHPEGLPFVQGPSAAGTGQRKSCGDRHPELLQAIQAIRLFQANDARRHGDPEWFPFVLRAQEVQEESGGCRLHTELLQEL